jgi:hypothetical protein
MMTRTRPRARVEDREQVRAEDKDKVKAEVRDKAGDRAGAKATEAVGGETADPDKPTINQGGISCQDLINRDPTTRDP